MNQKGEVSVISCLLIVGLMGIFLLCGLELQNSFHRLKTRSHLFLCVKETKGELQSFLKFMGRTNWAISHTSKAQLLALFIPGMQGLSMEAEKVKKYLQYLQEGRTISYLKILKDLKAKSCPLDLRMYKTPFRLGVRLLERDGEGRAILREEKWNYYYYLRPYVLEVGVEPKELEALKPSILYQTQEKRVKLSSLFY